MTFFGLRIQSPFRAADFPDLRLWRRARVTMVALARAHLHGRARTPALRRAARRFFGNRRIHSKRLLRRSARVLDPALYTAPVVLSCEDTTYVRGDAPDAGHLRTARDRGYVVHLAFATVPGTGRPSAWLGADVWTRLGPYRAQNHKDVPPSERESAKWARLRDAILARLRAQGVAGRIISINDREGDCWASLRAARDRGHEVITRVTQNRRLATGDKLFARVRRGHNAGVVALPLRVRTRAGRTSTRIARVRVRWTPVVLAAPSHDPFQKRDAPLPLVALEVREIRPPKGRARFQSRLLTTCPVADAAAARAVVGWYGERWSVEVGNDILKNALEVEAAVRTDVASFRRALALAGPTAAQLGQWLALARHDPPPPAAQHLTAAERTTLTQAARYHGVRLPAAPWTMADVIATVSRIGGGDVRATRPPGWRTVLNGWRRVEEFAQIAAFLRRERAPRRAATATRSTKKSRPP